MKIVKFIGGLGNQMFQFALYKALQNRFPEERILLDLHCFNGYHKHRGFEIGQLFHADYEEASLREVAKVAYPYPNYQCWRFGSRILPDRTTMLKERSNYAFEPSAFSRKGDTYYFRHLSSQVLRRMREIWQPPVLSPTRTVVPSISAAETM